MNAGDFQSESQQILSTLGKVIRRRRLIVILCVFGVLAPIVYYNQTSPPLYEASSTLVFEEFGAGVPSDVSVTPSHDLYLSDRIEEIKSLAFANEIARALPDSLKRRVQLPDENPAKLDTTALIGQVIQDGLIAFPVLNSDIIRIRVQMNDPYVSMVAANLALDVLAQRNDRFRHEGVTDLRKFVEAQLVRFEAQVKESDDALSRFKQANGITSLDAESVEALKKMSEAEILYDATRANQDAAQERLAAIQRTVAGQRKQLMPSLTSIASPSAQKLKAQLVDLQGRYAQLVVQGYPEDHPQRVQLQQQIDETKKVLTEEVVKLTKDTYVGDPIAQIEQYLGESVALQIEIESLNARGKALERSVGAYRSLLKSLPAKEVELARLLRERDVNAKIYASLLEKREEIRMSETKQLPNSRVIDRAELPTRPIKPRKILNLALGTIVGLILGMGMGLIRENSADKLGSMAKFERDTEWSILALVPKTGRGLVWSTWLWDVLWEPKRMRATRASRDSALVSHRNPESAAGEAYYMLRTRLELLGLRTKHRSLLVTSGGPREGKSSTIANLAVTLGAAGLATLVVDAEVRRPVMHTIFGVQKAPGLSDLLLAPRGTDGDLRPEVVLQETQVGGVTLLASGRRVRQTQWETAQPEMRGLLNDLGKQYDVVLVDAASPLLVHDTLVLCGLVDAVLVVVDAQSYDVDRLAETKRVLEQLQINVVGAVLNKVDPRGRYAYYYSHKDA